MKKNILAVLALVFVFAVGCKEDSSDEPQPETTFIVTYKATVAGGENLVIRYAEKDNKVNQISGVVTPWEQKLGEFSSGDSVIFDMSFNTLKNQQVSYNYSIDVERSNGSYVTGQQGSQTIAPADTSFTIQREWYYKIP
jgi:hypothetical protein